MQKLFDYLQQKFYYLGIIEGYIEPPLTILSISDVILFLQLFLSILPLSLSTMDSYRINKQVNN